MIRVFAGSAAIVGIAAWTLTPAEFKSMPKIAPAAAMAAIGVEVPQFDAVERPSAKAAAPDWVLGSPPSSTQNQTSPAERGVNPCLTPDPGFGKYGAWDRSPSIGQMLVPNDLELVGGEFPLMIHFHGHEPARKEWVQAIEDAVFVGIDLGINSGPYLRKFGDSSQFKILVESVEAAVADRLGLDEAHVGQLGVSSWSAGYGAIERVLRSDWADRVDTVILLDGLHSGAASTDRARRTLEPFVDFAEAAATGDKMMFVSHSSIVPPGYASTTETAAYLVWQMGGEPATVEPRDDDPMGLQRIREYDRGNFHVRGYAGNGPLDHCAHVGLYRKVLTDWLAPRWDLTTPD